MTVELGAIPYVAADGDALDAAAPDVLATLPPGTWLARSDRGLELFSYAAVEATYVDPAFVAGVTQLMARMGLRVAPPTERVRNLQTNETATHAVLRRAVSRWFQPRRVDALRPYVRDLVTRLTEPVTAAGGGELMSAMARRLPGAVFCWMVGAPVEEGDRLFRLSESLLKSFDGRPDDVPEIRAAAVELREFVDALVTEKQRQPGSDLCSVLLEAAAEGILETADIHALLFELLAASTDNTAHSIGLTLHLLARQEGAWSRLQADRGLVPRAVEECARLEPRVRVDSAWCPEGGTLLGVRVPPSQLLWQHIATAHLDPERFPEATTFSLDLPRAPQLGFGVGRHYCLGAALARMELAVTLDVLLDTWASYDIGDAVVTRGRTTACSALPVIVRPL